MCLPGPGPWPAIADRGILQNVPVTGAYQSPGHTFVETQKNLCDGNAGLVLCRFGNDFSGGLVIPVLTLQDRRTLQQIIIALGAGFACNRIHESD